MAFTKLREIRDKFEQNWINGGFIFGYENEINENHNNDYPLLVVLPPSSELPATEGTSEEEYTFECLIVKPYYQNQAGSLDVVFSLLEQEGLSWLQRVLDSYTNRDVILSPESISVEREKELYNDKLIQVRLIFTLNAFSHNFSFTDASFISNLNPQVWLRSDMGVKTSFSGGNEVVTKWLDQSGQGNHFEQTTLDFMPSYEYEMSQNGYPFLSFDGSNDFMSCVSNDIFKSGFGLSENNTMYFVVRVEKDSSPTAHILSKNSGLAFTAQLAVNARLVGEDHVFSVIHTDASANDVITNSITKLDAGATFTIVTASTPNFEPRKAELYVNGDLEDNVTFGSGFTSFGTYGTQHSIKMGASNNGDLKNCKMKIQEVMIFKAVHSAVTVAKVTKYLQHKYNIS